MVINFKLTESDGLTPRYTFPAVQYTNLPQDVNKFVEVGGRGNNTIIVPGSKDSWDLIIRGILRGKNWTYEDVIVAIDAMETALQFNTPYYAKNDKVEGGASTYSFKVKRLLPIEYLESLRNGKQVQGYTVTLRVNSW